MLIEHRLSHLN
jgi:hypothetical protein